MTPFQPSRDEIDAVVEMTVREAKALLAEMDERPVRQPDAAEAAASFQAPLPDAGVGAVPALRELLDRGLAATLNTAGPRNYHFVIGGTTPASLGADWLTTVLDQCAFAWVVAPLAIELEVVSLAWLRQLFGLDAKMTGVTTTGATMANFVCLAAARQWWGRRHGLDVGENGLAGAPPVTVLTSGYIHASATKALGMLGVGRASVRRFTRDAAGRLDVGAMRDALAALDGAPAIIIGNAGEVNAGDYDPIDTLADLADEFGAWLHVDGAFGLFARVSPRTAELCAGVERAQSVTVDGHKWLNVPYDCGFAFVHGVEYLGGAFAYSADYLPEPDDPHPNFGIIGPESSRRARSLSVWATLRAYGREGYRTVVERHLDLARHMAARVDDATDLERLAEVRINIVCFRYNPGGLDEEGLNTVNERLGQAILEDGRVYAGTTRFEGKVALRPAVSNWRTREADIDTFIDVVRELGARVSG